MLIQDISSPSKYKLSKIEISFSPPYFAQIDSVKKFKFSRQDITWSEYSCNHCQHYPTFYLQSFITICSSIFKKKSIISHHTAHLTPSQTRLLHKFHIQTKPKYWENWSTDQISQIIWPKRNEGGIACNNLTKIVVAMRGHVHQRPKKSELSGQQNSTRKNFPDEVCESFSRKKMWKSFFSRQIKCINHFRDKKVHEIAIWSPSQKGMCCFSTSSPFYCDIIILA